MLMKIACAILFLIFTFCFLYYYQADILTVEQHVLSHGQTHYDRTIGAVLITLLSTTTTTVIGIFLLVMQYLFHKR